MKKSLKYLPFLAALAFVGCSNDDEPANNGGGGEGPGYGYVAVNIMSSVGTRAQTDGFVDGEPNENKVKDGVFFIFKNDADQTKFNAQRLTFTGTETEDPDNVNIEKIYSAVLVIDGATEDPQVAGFQVVCVLNAPEGLETDESIAKLSDLTNKIGDYYTRNQIGKFIMTNSVYKNGDNVVVGTTIPQAYRSAAEAHDHPVDIYVERIVAKIETRIVKGTDNNNNFAITDPTVSISGISNTGDATTTTVNKTLKIVPTGLGLVNIANKSYLFKNITGVDYSWTWNDATNFRSYWEVVPEIGAEANPLGFDSPHYLMTYAGIVGINGTTFDIKTHGGRPYYVQPNTVAEVTSTSTETVQNNIVTVAERPTALVMTAKLMEDDGNGGVKSLDYTLAYIRGGYTTSDKAFEIVGKYLATTKDWYTRTGTAPDNYVYNPLTAADLEWKNNADLSVTVPGLKRYEVVAQLKNNVEVYNLNGTAPIANAQETVNAYLRSDAAKTYQARVFTDGMCYYYVYVKHHTEGDKVYNGVVRNHVYDLELTSVDGVGTPVFDENDIIIPETVEDETTFYLGARVNVLGWRTVATQNVEF